MYRRPADGIDGSRRAEISLLRLPPNLSPESLPNSLKQPKAPKKSFESEAMGARTHSFAPSFWGLYYRLLKGFENNGEISKKNDDAN